MSIFGFLLFTWNSKHDVLTSQFGRIHFQDFYVRHVSKDNKQGKNISKFININLENLPSFVSNFVLLAKEKQYRNLEFQHFVFLLHQIRTLCLLNFFKYILFLSIFGFGPWPANFFEKPPLNNCSPLCYRALKVN